MMFVFLCLSFSSLSVIPSRSVCVVVNGEISWAPARWADGFPLKLHLAADILRAAEQSNVTQSCRYLSIWLDHSLKSRLT